MRPRSAWPYRACAQNPRLGTCAKLRRACARRTWSCAWPRSARPSRACASPWTRRMPAEWLRWGSHDTGGGAPAQAACAAVQRMALWGVFINP